MLFLRPLHYSAVHSRPEDGVFGAGAHSDYGLMTILATDGTPGLEILHDGEWMPVQHVEGAVLINLGDMAERCDAYFRRQRACPAIGEHVHDQLIVSKLLRACKCL